MLQMLITVSANCQEGKLCKMLLRWIQAFLEFLVEIFREVMFYDNMIHFSTDCFYYRCFILVVVVILFGFVFFDGAIS